MLEVGFTGSQEGMTEPQANRLRSILHAIENARLHHGDCVGADRQAHYLARELGRQVVTHPPENPKKRAFCVGDEERPPKPYLERNRDIVEEVEVLLATPRTFAEELRSGTWSTVRCARKIGKSYVIIWPDGRVESHRVG